MKILVADAFPSARRADLAALGLAVVHRPELPAKALAAACCAIQLDDLPDAALPERIRARRDEVIFLECFDLSKGAGEAAAGAPPGRQEAPGAAGGTRSGRGAPEGPSHSRELDGGEGENRTPDLGIMRPPL